jgi:hypothetical protein
MVRGVLFAPLRLSQRRRELRPTVKRIRSLAGLDLDVLASDLEAFGFTEPCDGNLLGLKPQARAALTGGRDADVGDGGLVDHRLV